MPGEQIWIAVVPSTSAPPPRPPQVPAAAPPCHPAAPLHQLVLLPTRPIVEAVEAADRELPRICLTLESAEALAAGLLARRERGEAIDDDELEALLEEQQRILEGEPRFVRYPRGDHFRAPIGSRFEVGGLRLERRGTHWVARKPYVLL